MLPKLEGYAAALLGSLDAAVLATVASDLASLEQTILGRADLRAVLTDTSIAGASRGRIVRDLLNGKVARGHRCASPSTPRATSRPRRSPHSLAELAVAARTCQWTGTSSLAEPRAAGVARSASADSPTRCSTTSTRAELRRDRGRTLPLGPHRREQPGAAPAAARPRRRRSSRASALVEQLLAARWVRVTLAPGALRHRGRTPPRRRRHARLPRGLRRQGPRLARRARAHRASPRRAEPRPSWSSSLAALTGKNVELQIADESRPCSGGVLVEIGDLRLDATTRGRLGALRDAVAPGHLYESTLNRND